VDGDSVRNSQWKLSACTINGSLNPLSLHAEDGDKDATALRVSGNRRRGLVVIVKADKKSEGWILLVICAFIPNDVTHDAYRAIKVVAFDPKVLSKHDASINGNRKLLVQVSTLISIGILRS
jgi:hypothetical protein